MRVQEKMVRTLPIALAAAAILASPAAAQHAAVRTSKPVGSATAGRCNPVGRTADYNGRQAMPKKLGEMPPASQIYAVYNQVDGCPQPIVVRKGIGADPHRRVAPTR